MTFAELTSMAMRAFLQPLAWVVTIFDTAGATSAYLTLFLVYTLMRLIIKPIIGQEARQMAAEIRGKDSREKGQKNKSED